MIKHLLFCAILLSVSYSDSHTIKELQEEFHKDVIELNIFKKRFSKYIKNACKDDLRCQRNTVQKLKSWESVQNDKKLHYYFKQKSKKLQFDEEYWKEIVHKLHSKNIFLDHSQFVSVIDLEKQLYIITLWDDQSEDFHFIGKDFISSGNINREKEVKRGEDHYLKTPSGVFKSGKGWRSDGKFSDDNITLGYGKKDRYIFYFGKQQSIRYNTFDKNKQKIYDPEKWQLITDHLDFAIHAHSSSRSLGVPNSHGCIRMTDELNRFLDNNSILHKNMFEDKKWIHKYAKEPNDPKYYDFAGEYLIVFDTVAQN
ncbi:MAG: L,D-transpeptidase [Arcobacteraceae bacterium]